MTAFAHLALLAAAAAGFLLMRRRPGARPVFALYVFGTLFLPEFGAAGTIEGVPAPLGAAGVKLTKPNALALGLLAGSLVYDWRRWRTARPRWFDAPVALWCVGPVISSVGNSLFYDDPVSRTVPLAGDALGAAVAWLDRSDLYDGLVRSVDVVFGWGAPYLLGRLYVTDRDRLTELARWVVAGAAAYVPFCLAETVLSPQLHRWVYGFHQHEFLQSIRFGGFRPTVFLSHGIAVGFWMVAGALCAFWLWATGPLTTVPHPLYRGRVIGGLWVVVPLAATAVLCKSTGALVLGFVGLSTLVTAWLWRSPAPALALLVVPPLYVVTRTTGAWEPRASIPLVAAAVGPERADSLDFRLRNEDALTERALDRPLIGWGGWGRWQVFDQYGKLLTVADGLWVITLGERGLLGLVTLGLVLLLPPAVALARGGAAVWTDPRAPAVGLVAVVLGLFAVDCLMNAMLNPVYVLLAGGLVALRGAAAPPEPLRVTARKGWRVRVTPKATRCRAAVVPGASRALAATPCRPALPTGAPPFSL